MDVAGTNWMQHFATTASLVQVGSNPSVVVGSIAKRHNMAKNLAFWSREPLTNEDILQAQVQSIIALRVVQEYIAAMETTGALLRAIRDRSRGGVMRLNHGYNVEDLRTFFGEIRASRRHGLPRLLNWPTPSRIARAGHRDLAARAQRTFPKMRSWLIDLATMYVKGKSFRLVDLGRRRRSRDSRDYAYVFVHVLEKGEKRPRGKASVIVQALNKLKHGFNATVLHELYRTERGALRGLVAVEIPKRWPTINAAGLQVDLLSVICREAARFTLDFDEAGLL